MQTGNNTITYKLIDKTIDAAIKINFNHIVGRLYNLRAISKQNSGDNNGALEDYYLALDSLAKYHDEGWSIAIYSNMSIIYLEIEDFTKGLEINELAFRLYKSQQINNPHI